MHVCACVCVQVCACVRVRSAHDWSHIWQFWLNFAREMERARVHFPVPHPESMQYKFRRRKGGGCGKKTMLFLHVLCPIFWPTFGRIVRLRREEAYGYFVWSERVSAWEMRFSLKVMGFFSWFFLLLLLNEKRIIDFVGSFRWRTVRWMWVRLNI